MMGALLKLDLLLKIFKEHYQNMVFQKKEKNKLKKKEKRMKTKFWKCYKILNKVKYQALIQKMAKQILPNKNKQLRSL